MDYRRLGRSGLQISTLSLGSWLTFANTIEKENSIAIIDKAYELGINFFDCANVYSMGESEKLLGEVLNRYPRENVVVSTKAFWPMNDTPNGKGLSRKHLKDQFNASLQRLKMDYVDIFYCHRFDSECDLYETLRTIDDFIRQGKALYIGVSEWSAAQIVEALGTQDKYLLDRIITNQPVYNLLNRKIEKDILPTCIKNGIGVTPFSPLAQGFLSGKYRKGKEIPKDSRAANGKINEFMQSYLTPENFDRIEKFINVANRKECSPSQLALSWLLHKPGITSVLIGASSVAQVEENVKAIEVSLTKEDLTELENIFSESLTK
ncbi:MAG: aldo/keto reductase family protein [Brevinema sp.]